MRAILDMHGFGCGSCCYTIEHIGRKMRGVEDIHVDLAKREIHVQYDGNAAVLDEIRNIVHRIGHEATVRETHAG